MKLHMNFQIKCRSLWNSVYVEATSVWAADEKENRLMKTAGSLSAIVTTRLCDVLQCASPSIRGPLLNCVADSSRLYGTQIHTRTLLDQFRDPFSKKPPSHSPGFRSGMHVICPCRCLNPSPALVSFVGGTLPGRRYDTMSLCTRLDSSQGRGQALEAAPAVRCCKWLSELTDRSPAIPAALQSIGSAHISRSTLCVLCLLFRCCGMWGNP